MNIGDLLQSGLFGAAGMGIGALSGQGGGGGALGGAALGGLGGLGLALLLHHQAKGGTPAAAAPPGGSTLTPETNGITPAPAHNSIFQQMGQNFNRNMGGAPAPQQAPFTPGLGAPQSPGMDLGTLLAHFGQMGQPSGGGNLLNQFNMQRPLAF